MIRTITETEAPNLTIRGDLTDVLGDWIGPCTVIGPIHPHPRFFNHVYCGTDPECGKAAHVVFGFDAANRIEDPKASGCFYDTVGITRAEFVELPVARPEVQAHLVGWLGRGAWCPPCGGGGFEGLVETPTRYGCPACSGSATKRGTGYLRPPADLYHLLKPAALGGLPDWIRLAMIWGSVVRVAAGMGPVSTIWTPIYGDKNPTRRWFRNYAGGPFQETSFAYNDTESAARDSRLIRAGCTLVDDTPTGRVIRFEVPDAP